MSLRGQRVQGLPAPAAKCLRLHCTWQRRLRISGSSSYYQGFSAPGSVVQGSPVHHRHHQGFSAPGSVCLKISGLSSLSSRLLCTWQCRLRISGSSSSSSSSLLDALCSSSRPSVHLQLRVQGVSAPVVIVKTLRTFVIVIKTS